MRSAALLLACVALAGQEPGSLQDPAMDFQTYARLCEELIAEVPPLDARAAQVIPITVNGEEPPSYEPGMTCDRPALLPTDCGGPCTPYTRILRLRDDDVAQMVVMYRRSILRPEDSPLFDEIDLILHSPVNGYTCWFLAKPSNPDCDPGLGLDTTRVPSPSDPGAESFWNPLADVVQAGCGDCHDNDPFYLSPYVEMTGQVPANPFGRYSNAIGPFTAWNPLVSLTTRGNTCTGCHRIGTTFTCGEGLEEATGLTVRPGEDERAQTYPWSHWMPIANQFTEEQWRVIYRDSVERLLACCERPGNPECLREPIR